MKYDFVSVGDVTNDSFITLKDAEVSCDIDKVNCKLSMRFGDKIPYESLEEVFGVGNAGNAAISAKRLGLNAALVADIGADTGGDNCIATWEKDGLDTTFVRRHADLSTHHHFVLRYGPERTILIKHAPWPYKLPNFSEPPKWMYFTSTSEFGEQYHHEIAQYVKDNNVKLAFQPGTFQINLSIEDKIPDIYAVSELFFCNKQEAQKILKNDSQDIRELLKSMRERGPKIVAITDGPNGAWMISDEGVWMIPMYPDPAPPVSRTGAGDAFSSTITSMLAIGMSVPDALMRGPINSMSVVQKIGAQTGLITSAQLEEYVKNAPAEYKITKL